jgi:hypothetical protein
VLAFDLGHHTNALYYYCRALAVTQPFANAKKNLLHVLEQNVQLFKKVFAFA